MEEIIKNFLEKKEFIVEIIKNKIITTHKIGAKVIRLAGELPKDFPYSLPNIYLLDRDSYGSLAHVGWNDSNEGLICEGISINRHIDYSEPEEIYLKALKNALSIIQDLFYDNDKNKKEIIEEFSAHWRFLIKSPKDGKVISFIEQNRYVKKITVFLTQTHTNFPNYCCFDSIDDPNPNYSYAKRLKKKKQNIGKGIYLPIKNQILPPGPTEELSNWWKKILSSLPIEKKILLKDIARQNKSKTFWVLASVKTSEDNDSWFCLKFTSSNKKRPPLAPSYSCKEWTLTPYPVEIHNRTYLKPRGGAINGFRSKKLAIVGCGLCCLNLYLSLTRFLFLLLA